MSSSIEPEVAYRTEYGFCVQGTAEDVLQSRLALEHLQGVDLIFTSPPFPLNTKKKYGNLQGQAYVDWLASFAPRFRDLLSDRGSIVMEMGNSWVPGQFGTKQGEDGNIYRGPPFAGLH